VIFLIVQNILMRTNQEVWWCSLG